MKIANFKLTFLISIILFSYLIEIDCRIRHKRASTQRRFKKVGTKIDAKEAFKFFFRGFLMGVLVGLITPEQVKTETGEDPELTFQKWVEDTAIDIIDSCIPESIAEYEAIINQYRNSNMADPQVLSKVFTVNGDKDRLLKLCQENLEIQTLEGDKFCLTERAICKLTGFFTDRSKYQAEYATFEARKEENTRAINVFSEASKLKLLGLQNSSNTDAQTKSIASAILSQMSGVIFSNNICEGVKNYLSIPFAKRAEALFMGSFKGLVCGLKTTAVDAVTVPVENIIQAIFEMVGGNLAKHVVVAIFPPAIAAIIAEFIINNLSDILNITTAFLSDDSQNKNASLFQTLGKIAGKLVAKYLKKRKLRRRLLKK